jgi:hypothetical protein
MDIAILPDNLKSYVLFVILMINKEIVKLNKRTINGFISV